MNKLVYFCIKMQNIGKKTEDWDELLYLNVGDRSAERVHGVCARCRCVCMFASVLCLLVVQAHASCW